MNAPIVTGQVPPSLPGRSRFLAIVGMVFAAFVGVSSAADAIRLSALSNMPDLGPVKFGDIDPKVWQQVWKTQLAMLNGMKEPRTFLLACLAFASALSFVALGRLLRPAGLPREGMRRLLVGSALAAAILRVIEGAQIAVISKKVGAIIGAAISKLPEAQVAQGPQVDYVHFCSRAMLGATMLWSLLVASVFLIVSQHFRSPKIRELVEKTDAHLE